jgi:hypothetical protein
MDPWVAYCDICDVFLTVNTSSKKKTEQTSSTPLARKYTTEGGELVVWMPLMLAFVSTPDQSIACLANTTEH